MRYAWIAGLVLCAGGVVAAYAYLMPHGGQPAVQDASAGVFAAAGAQLAPAATSSSTALKPHRTPPAGQKEYYSERYRFSFFYPQDLSVKTYNEGGGATTITLQNADPQNPQGFQIFVVPYGATQVTEARFKEDEPSGVRTGTKSVSIDGATGASFYSTNPALGDTAEVWFVHDGYLFEVTTLKPLSGWLSNIMQSWEFL